MSQCRICQNPSNSVMNSTCQHPICYDCIHKEFIYNLKEISHMEGIDKEINLKCIICDSGFFKISKQKIHEVLQFIPNARDSFSNKCLYHKKDSLFYCIDCKKEICSDCFENHKNHIISQNYFGNKRTCARCKDEILKLQCIKCSMPCCVVCEKTLHTNHEFLLIEDYYAKNYKEIKTIKLPFEYPDELIEYLKMQQNISIENFEDNCKELIKKIDGLVTKLKDLIESINFSFEKKVAEIKTSYSIFTKIFKKIYSDISTVTDDDFSNLHLLSKLQKNFSSFSMNVYTVANYEENINSIKNEIEKIKNESNNYKKLRFDWEYNNYSLLNTSSQLNCSVYSQGHLKSGFIVSGSNNSIYVHDLNLKLINTINHNNINESSCILLMPDNKIVVGSNEARLFIYDANDKYKQIKRIDSINLHATSCLEFVCNKNNVVCGSLNGNISVIDSQNWIYLNTLSANSPIRCLLYIPDRDILLSGSDDKLIKVWNTNKDYIVIRSLTGHNNPVYSLCSLRNGLFASGCSTEIKIWDEEFICQKTIQAHSSRITNLKLLDNGDLVSSSIDKTFKVWSKYSFYCIMTVDVGSPIYSLLTIPQNNIFTGTQNKEIKKWSKQILKI